MLQDQRNDYKVPENTILKDFDSIEWVDAQASLTLDPEIRSFFKHHANTQLLELKKCKRREQKKVLKVGVFFSGGQAPGGHSVIAGLYDGLKALNAKSILLGLKGGPSGLLKKDYVEITDSFLKPFRHTGGFHMLGSGRTKIETDKQFQEALSAVRELDLQGLVVIGGDDSNTNAALLAEYFTEHQQSCFVIGIPKTIDGDLRNQWIEMSFGFDTATKTYSEMIGNIGQDALSAKKYYHFIKLMGRSASNVALECALLTHPNITLISEEIESKKMRLQDVVEELTDSITRRFDKGKSYGLIVIPEGVLEFMVDMKTAIRELNTALAEHGDSFDLITHVSKQTQRLFKSLPKGLQEQLLMDRDPHGNVQVSHIETEKLLAMMVKENLQKKRPDVFKAFKPVYHFFGYEGRSGFPTIFDCCYCYYLGKTASLLVDQQKTSFVVALTNLKDPVSNWRPKALSLTSLMHLEERKGQVKPVIKKALVGLSSKAFKSLEDKRKSWLFDDDYQCIGPIQFTEKECVTIDRPHLLGS